jgi:hypothetical protein
MTIFDILACLDYRLPLATRLRVWRALERLMQTLTPT